LQQPKIKTMQGFGGLFQLGLQVRDLLPQNGHFGEQYSRSLVLGRADQAVVDMVTACDGDGVTVGCPSYLR
jgi:hypothetical protein